MTTKRTWAFALLVTALAVTLGLTGTTFAKKGGNGGGGNPPPPPEPELPPVVLEAQLFSAPIDAGINSEVAEIRCTNSSGVSVGYYRYDSDGDGSYETSRGFVYDPVTDSGGLGTYGIARDLTSIVSMPEGFEDYTVRQAWGINEWGDIAAYLEPPDTVDLRAVMIDMSTGTVHVIPDEDITSWSIGLDINEFGDIAVAFVRSDGTVGCYVHNVGLYDPALETSVPPVDLGVTLQQSRRRIAINNSNQLVGKLDYLTAFRMNYLTGSLEQFSGPITANDINDHGEFCGTTWVPTKGNRGYESLYVAGSAVEVFDSDALGDAYGLNESRDIVSSGAYVPPSIVYQNGDGSWQAIDTRLLLAPDDPNVALLDSDLTLQTITDRDATTDFPIVTGTTSGFGVVLIPFSAP